MILCLDRLKLTKHVDSDTPTGINDTSWLADLTVLAEVLSKQRLAGSYELVSALLEVLGRVASIQDVSHAEIRYIEQLLMSAIESTALRINVRNIPRALMVALTNVMDRNSPTSHRV